MAVNVCIVRAALKELVLKTCLSVEHVVEVQSSTTN